MARWTQSFRGVVVVIRRTALLLSVAFVSSSCALVGLAPSCSGNEIIAKFDQVGDLVENSNVQSSDVEIGNVQNIELEGWDARVTMCLESDQKISSDVVAVVRTTSLLGEKFIDLQVQSEGPPFLEDGAVLSTDQTSKATELEEVFAKLAGVLGTGNLEQINRFTSAQATILRDHAGELRNVLVDLRKFTDTLAGRKDQIASAVDRLDSVARTLLDDRPVIQNFLRSFADSSDVLASQEEGLRSLLFTLDRFTDVSVQLLRATESGLNEQFAKLRPILATVVANSANLRRSLVTLAGFSQMFPESMPGEYLQLDVCQAGEEDTDQGTNCHHANAGASARGFDIGEGSSAAEYILMNPLRGPR